MSSKKTPIDIIKYFSDIEDPRIDRQKLHALPDILFIVFCGAICGVETWEDFVDFAECKIDFIKKYTDLKNGIPSKNTFNRVISRLSPSVFRDSFLRWATDFEVELGRVIAIDGKVLKGSHNKASGGSAIHMVSAFAAEARLVLAQEKVAEKSNEITAIPQLIDHLNINDAVVTIDAMGCQKSIADKIITAGGDYVLALKGNQGTLHAAVKKHFNNTFDMQHNKHVDVSTQEETSRGRREKRMCLSTDKLDWLSITDQWPGLKSCIAVVSQRVVNDQTSEEIRFYISSLDSNAAAFNQIVRSHWAIENSLHWVMDVVFREDDSRIRAGHGAENMSMIKHVALNKLQAAKPLFKKSMTIKRLRKNAGWDDEALETILNVKI